MTLSKIIEQLKAAEQNKTGMFELGEDVMCALVDLLERRERDVQEPVRYMNRFTGACFTQEQQPDAATDTAVYVPLYAETPAAVVPEEMYWQDAPVEGSTRAAAYAIGWNACRAAMLKQPSSIQASDSADSGAEIKQPASNSPVIPDGFRIVSLDALGAACGALQRHAPDCKTLKLLRRYTFGDLSKPSASLAAAPKQESE